MQIIRDTNYLLALDSILEHITKDSFVSANKFSKALDKKINKLPNMPYKFRQSLYYDDENIRDFIFKGYTIPYLIDESDSTLVILDIFKWVQR